MSYRTGMLEFVATTGGSQLGFGLDDPTWVGQFLPQCSDASSWPTTSEAQATLRFLRARRASFGPIRTVRNHRRNGPI